MGVRPTDVAVERQASICGRCMCGCQGDSEESVGAKSALIWRAVEIDHCLINASLIGGFSAKDRLRKFAVDIANSGRDSLTTPSVAAIAQFNGFERSG